MSDPKVPQVGEGQVIDFGLNNFQEGGFLDGATVTFTTVRYGKTDYTATQDNPNPEQKIAIEVIMGTSKGKSVTKKYSTGLRPGVDADTTPDGKQLKARKGYKGLSKASDAYFFLQQAVNAGFPEDRIKNDISVFDDSSFTMASGKNPRATKGGEKPYPHQFHPSGNPGAAVNPAAMSVPASAVDIDADTLTVASDALRMILSEQPSITRADIPKKLNAIATKQGWDATRRQKTTLALWDLPKLQAVVMAAGLTINGEVVSS